MKLLILDRDGVINCESSEYIKAPEEWVPIRGSLEAIARLSQAGYDIVVITNQSAIGRGMITPDMLGQIHVRMIDYIQQHGGKIQSVLFCPHHPDDNCDCRKPKPGLYHELADRLSISFNGVYSVGDSLRDLQAAEAAGASPVLVRTGNGKDTLRTLKEAEYPELDGTLVFDNLAKFADHLLQEELAA